jgi:type IV pilus assembly protein PilO
MAASTVMADFGRLPTSRKVFVFGVVGLLLGVLYYRLIYAPLAEKAAEARGVYETSQRKHAAGVTNLKRYDTLRPEVDKLRARLARNQAALPTEAEVPAFFETLERKVKESGIEITKWTKRAEEPIESFVKVPVEIEITGTFMQIKRFFASLVQKNLNPDDADERERERERIVSIESLVISQPQVRNREIILAAKFVAVTFRQDEKVVPGKPGAAASPAGTPPPLKPKGADSAPAAGGAGAGGAPAAGSASDAGAGADRLKKGM